MSKKKQPITAIEKYEAIQAIGPEVQAPHNVWTAFGSQNKKISIIGEYLCLGDEADYKSIDQVRDSVAWYVEQLGGTVTWRGD